MLDTSPHLQPIPVSSLTDEDQFLGFCRCGGAWILAHEEVLPLIGRWYDSLVVRCGRCGSYSRAIFDITRFFEPKTWAWSR